MPVSLDCSVELADLSTRGQTLIDLMASMRPGEKHRRAMAMRTADLWLELGEILHLLQKFLL